MPKYHVYYGTNIVNFWYFSLTVAATVNWPQFYNAKRIIVACMSLKWPGEYKDVSACCWRVCCGAVWYFGWTGLCVCVCFGKCWRTGAIIRSAGHHRQPDRLARHRQRVCAANMPRAQDSSPHRAQTYACTGPNTRPRWCGGASLLKYSNMRGFCLTVWELRFDCHPRTKPCHTSSGKISDCRFVIAAVVLTQLVTTSDTSLTPMQWFVLSVFVLLRFAMETGFLRHVKALAALKELMQNVASGNWSMCGGAGPGWGDWHREQPMTVQLPSSRRILLL